MEGFPFYWIWLILVAINSFQRTGNGKTGFY